VFFIAVYSICEHLYPYDGTVESDRLWWNLKCDLYLFLVAVWIFIASLPKCTDRILIRINKLINAIGIGYGMANFIDRRVFHDREFGWNDLTIVIIIVLVGQINLPKINKQAKQHAKNLT
jgi:hypothetical protein